MNLTSTHHDSTDQLFLKLFKLSLPPKLSAPDQCSSSYEALRDSKKCCASAVASEIRLYRWSTMSLTSPISQKWSSRGKVIIMRQGGFQGGRRQHGEIYLPIGAFVWPHLRHKGAASCFCERCFNLIKSRLMGRWLPSPELQMRLSKGKNTLPSRVCHCPVTG